MTEKSHGRLAYEHLISLYHGTLEDDWQRGLDDTGRERWNAVADAIRQPLLDQIAELQRQLDRARNHTDTTMCMMAPEEPSADAKEIAKAIRQSAYPPFESSSDKAGKSWM